MSREGVTCCGRLGGPVRYAPGVGRCPLGRLISWGSEALTIFTVKGYLESVDDVRVLADAAAVEVALDPIRASILDALTEPGSAATVAAAVGSTRQKVNYHLKALEAHGLVELAEERAWGGITERFLRRSARHLVVAPDVLHRAAIDPNEVADRLSAAYLIAVNARSVSEVGAIARSAATGARLPTLTVDTVIGFGSPEDRAAFATDLQSAIAALVARYHHDDGRPHRLTVSSYPRPEEPS
jgi:DNA-binding transcriptional ArsR family regulator